MVFLTNAAADANSAAIESDSLLRTATIIHRPTVFKRADKETLLCLRYFFAALY